MQRFTLSIDDELAERFDAYLTEHGYANRSECFRDILRNHFTSEDVKDNPSAECVGVLSYAYNHHERQLAMRMTEYQHEHAGEVISTMHVHATHEECVESVVIRGRRHALPPPFGRTRRAPRTPQPHPRDARRHARTCS